MEEPAIIVGIDLGTTNSVVALFRDKESQTLLIDNEKLLPSVVVSQQMDMWSAN